MTRVALQHLDGDRGGLSAPNTERGHAAFAAARASAWPDAEGADNFVYSN